MQRVVSVAVVSVAVCCATAAGLSPPCGGDCNGDARVTVDELLTAVGIALGTEPPDDCPAADGDGDGRVTIAELIAAVAHALRDDCPGQTVALMLPGREEEPFGLPWPNDVARFADGGLDVSGFPGVEANPLLGPIVLQAARDTAGFGTNSAVYFRTSGPLDPDSLPTPEETAAGGGGVLVAAVDDPSAPPAPVLVGFAAEAGALRPPNLLAILPYPGHPLRGATRYAVLLFRDLRDTAGRPLARAPLLQQLDEGAAPPEGLDPATWEALRGQWTAVRHYLSAGSTRSVDEVVAFTVFTTQDVTREMRAIAAAVEALPEPTPVARERGECGSFQRATLRGTLDLPKWQAGEFPYFTSGGEIVVEDGRAVQQGTERVEFEVTYPCAPAPEEGWPILLFMDGTGAGPESRNVSELGAVDAVLPYVVVSIAPLYSGDRAVEPLPPPFDLGGEAFLFFNYLNPVAGRTNQLQQAADMLYLQRIAKGLELGADETRTGAVVATNDDLVVVAGHSQGALTVPHILASNPTIDAGFISAGGGGLYHSLVHRGDIRPLVETLAGVAPGELDEFHPILHLVQTLSEIGDAANYAPAVTAAHVLSVGGLKDGCSPWEVVSHLGTALGLPVAGAAFHPTFGSAALEPPVIDFPVLANLAGGRTGVTVQLDTGHFGATSNSGIGRSFVESLAWQGVAAVDPPPLVADFEEGCAGRFDPLPPQPLRGAGIRCTSRRTAAAHRSACRPDRREPSAARGTSWEPTLKR